MLYRKHRPQTWRDLDSTKIRETLGKAILNNEWAHAYLLIGTRGVGKTTAARLIAKTLNCSHRQKGEEPCNQCRLCQAITRGESLDVVEIDAASNTGVEDIRSLREKIKLAPSEAPFKVYIIDEVHMLSTAAFNALLKTLEEPPSHAVFVLCTTDPQKLPETIISRCLVYDFGRASREDIKQSLGRVIEAEGYQVLPETLEAIISKANGSFRDAVKILEQVVSSGQDVAAINSARLTAERLVPLLLLREKVGALREVEAYIASNGRIRDLLGEMLAVMRDKLLSGEGNQKELMALIPKLIEANSWLRDSPIASLPLELVIVEWCEAGTVKENDSQSSAKTGKEERKDGAAPSASSIVGEEKKEKEEKTASALTKAVSESKAESQKGIDEFVARWGEIVAATKPYNHSLNAFLKAANPGEVRDGLLVVQVAYKFHKEKLEEPKNRDILEKVIFGILGETWKVRFELKPR